MKQEVLQQELRTSLLLASQEVESDCTQITEQALPEAVTAEQKS